MVRKIISIVVCMLLFATVFAVAQPQTNTDSTDSVTSTQNTSQPLRSPGDVLFDWDCETAHGNTGSLGAEWDGQYIWSTARANPDPLPHKIYKWDLAGNLLATFDQPTQASAWGMRDMAFDGTFLYAGSENGFWKIDPATGACTLMFASIAPMTVIRALTWVPSEGMFYTGSFGLGWFKFTPDGTTKTPVANPGLTAVYGMAYDSLSDTIWVFDQTGTPQTTFFQYDYHTGALTGVSYVVPMLTGLTDQIAGGAFFATNCVPGKIVLGGLVQGTVKDRIFGMELGSSNAPPATPAAPSGPTDGVVDISYDFTATTTDPDNDDIYYWFDWDDGTNTGWLGPFASGTPKTASHSWAAAGTYDVTVKAKDAIGGESSFSPAHTIVIAEGPSVEIGNITGGLFKVKAIVKNTGAAAATNIEWSIKLTGGFILIGGETTGNILALDPGDEREISSGPIIGFGKTVITVTADTVTKDQNATVLLFFIIIK